MTANREYAQFASLMELIEGMSAGRRTESVTFRDDAGRVLGLLTLDSGSVRFGVHVSGRLFLDEVVISEAPRHVAALQKILNRLSLTRGEKEALADLSPQHHAALCGLTARALRRIASLWTPTRQTGLRAELGPPQLRIAGASFTPVELALAAGRQGSFRADDAAARIYASPPVQPEENWLFEWQPDESSLPWPVQTTRLGERRAQDVAAFGALGQQLARYFSTRRRLVDRTRRRAQLLRLGESIFYLVSSARYMAMQQYPLVQLGRLLWALEDFAGQATVRAPDLVLVPRSRDTQPPAAASLSSERRGSAEPPPRA